MKNKLVRFRVKQKLTQKQMSEKIGTTLTFYCKVEIGVRNPSYNFIVKFKNIFPDANVDEIFFNNELHEMC